MDYKASVFYKGGEVNYDFPFPYLKKKFVKVRYKKPDGSYEYLEYNKDYSVSDKKVTLHTAGSPDDVINIYRQTPSEQIVDFTDASVLKASDLNVYQTQLLHIAEETSDGLQSGSLSVNGATEQWDADHLRITNLADAQDEEDAVNLRTLKAWNTHADDARQSAEEAKEALEEARRMAQEAHDSAEIVDPDSIVYKEKMQYLTEGKEYHVGDCAWLEGERDVYYECLKDCVYQKGDMEGFWVKRDIRQADTAKVADKLSTAHRINGVAFDGTEDIKLPDDVSNTTSYIAKGLRMKAGAGRSVVVSTGVAKVNGITMTPQETTVELPARSTSMVYVDHEGEVRHKEVSYPYHKIDNNTVGFWVFNETKAGAVVPNVAVGKSVSAVENDLIPFGGIKSVDGWADYALQTDGVNGRFVARNNTKFPTNVLEINLMFTLDDPRDTRYLMSYQYGQNYIGIAGTNNLYTINAKRYYRLQKGDTVLLTEQFDGVYHYIFVNGVLIYAAQEAPSFPLHATRFMSLGCINDADNSYPIRATFHYLEIRNKPRSATEVREIANSLCLPCYYNRALAEYPKNIKSPTAHEWHFDSTIPNVSPVTGQPAQLLIDEIGTTHGTVMGSLNCYTKSETIGNSMRFVGDINQYVALPTMKITPEFTFCAVVKAFQRATYTTNRIFGITTGAANKYLIISLGESSGLSLYYNGTWYNSALHFDLFKDNFVSLIAHNGVLQFRVNEKVVYRDFPQTIEMSAPMSFGRANDGRYPYNGYLSYAYFDGQKALDAEDLEAMYRSLMSTGKRDLLTDFLPTTGGAVVGLVHTDSNEIAELNDTDYKTGRRNFATGGNRRVFLGWKWFSGQQLLCWENPFGTSLIRTYFRFKKQPAEDISTDLIPRFYTSRYYGFQPTANSADGFTRWITAQTWGANESYLGGSSGGSGFIGCWAEIIEDWEDTIPVPTGE